MVGFKYINALVALLSWDKDFTTDFRTETSTCDWSADLLVCLRDIYSQAFYD